MKPYCDCQDCKDRTKERLRTATDSSARHAIAVLKAHIAEMDKKEANRG